MRKPLFLFTALFLCAQTTAPSLPVAAPLSGKTGKPINLLADGLTGWTWVQRPPKAGAAQPAPVAKEAVWTVTNGILHDAGKPIGYLRTDAEYDNYILTVEQRHVVKGNGGVLFAISGPDKVWPHGLECQGQNGEEGDLRNIAEFKNLATDPARTEPKRVRRAGRNPEKPAGEWETVEITVDHGNLTVKLNGEVQNTATYTGSLKGKIGLQAEGGEMEFRKIELAPIESN
ncbi:MAG: 3-keto-disaccharide hydrolase [Phycisphaerae bacterium]